jgi:hypothetical protein
MALQGLASHRNASARPCKVEKHSKDLKIIVLPLQEVATFKALQSLKNLQGLSTCKSLQENAWASFPSHPPLD